MKKTLLLLTLSSSLLTVSAQIISTVAGSATGGFSGNGGQATAAQLARPYGVVVDGAGNLYIADFNNNDVRIVDNAGIINTFAGTQVSGFSGDGGQATAAQLASAAGVNVDGSGNVYIADANNNRLRIVAPSGVINTIAGNGIAGCSGDGGQATLAELDLTFDVVTDALGNTYISDYTLPSIRMVSPSGVISTVAGNGTGGYSGDGGQATAAQLNAPPGITLDGSGNLVIADYMNNRVRMVNSLGVITTIAGNGSAVTSGDGGPATAAGINQPVKVVYDGVGNLYIAEYSGQRIRVVNSSGNISTLAGTGSAGFSGDGGLATAAQLNFPVGITYNNGNLYIADASNFRVRMVNGGPLAANKVVNKTAFMIYPNPSNGQFQIVMASEAKQSQSMVEVYNMLGEKVYRQEIRSEKSEVSIDLGNQPNGIYLLKLQSNDGSILTKKIEIAR